MNRSPIAAFATSPLFAGWTAAQLDRLVALGRVRRFAAGAVLFRTGDPADAAYAVLTGHLHAVLGSADGREMVVRKFGPGEVLGELAVLHGGPRSATLVCVSSTDLLRIDGRAFLQLVEGDPALSHALLAALARRLADTTVQLSDLAFRALPARLAGKLLELAETDDDGAGAPGLEIRISQQELASLLGCARESVNKHLRTFEDRGWIVLGRTRLAIRDPEALRTLASMATPGS